MSTNTNTATDKLDQLVVFSLASESYGVNIDKINGIERMHAITIIPRTDDSVEGVINLRGQVVPVVDLRKVLNLPVTEETKDTRIVVVEMTGQQVGCLVDAVTEVLRISHESVEPPSSLVTSAGSDYLLGIAKLENRLITLLDLEKALISNGTLSTTTEKDLSLVEEITSIFEQEVILEPETNPKPKSKTKTGTRKPKGKKSKKVAA